MYLLSQKNFIAGDFLLKMIQTLKITFFIFVIVAFGIAQTASIDESYFSLNAEQIKKIGETWRVKGRVGGFFDTRIRDTDKSINFKLRATLMSPEMIRATAKFEQLRNALTDDETRSIVKDAEQGDYLVVLVEVDPLEGSGIIPPDWRVILKSKNNPETNRPIKGVEKSSLRNVKGLSGVFKRDYDYDMFWMTFPLKDNNGKPFWESVPVELELTVGIYSKEGKVSWSVSEPLQKRIESLIR